MENYAYKLHECLELSLADIEVHFSKLAPTVSEPEAFVKAIRETESPRDRLLILKAHMARFGG